MIGHLEAIEALFPKADPCKLRRDLDLFFYHFPVEGLLVILWHPGILPAVSYNFFNN